MVRSPESPLSFSLSYATAYGITFEDFIEQAVERGFSDVQLIPDQEPNLYSEFDKSRIERLLHLSTKYGLQYRVHNVFYDINPLSLVPAVRDAALAVTKEIVAFAKAIRAKTVTVHAGYMFPGWRRDPVQSTRFWSYAEQSLRRLADLASGQNVDLLIENGSYYVSTRDGLGHKPLHVGVDPEELRRLIDVAEGRLGVCLDLNKALHSSSPLGAFVSKVGPWVRELQVSSVRDHEAEIGGAIEALKAESFKGAIVLEGTLQGSAETRSAILRLLGASA